MRKKGKSSQNELEGERARPPKKRPVESAWSSSVRRSLTNTWNRNFRDTTNDQGNRSLQPANQWHQKLSLQVMFCKTLRQEKPEIITDLFLKIFDALSKHRELLGYRNFRVNPYPINYYLWSPPPSILLGTGSKHPYDKSGLLLLQGCFYQAIKDWMDEYKINSDWCREFTFSVFDRFWGWTEFKDAPPRLLICVLRFWTTLICELGMQSFITSARNLRNLLIIGTYGV